MWYGRSNKGFAYAFSVNRLAMCILASWPLQEQKLYVKLQRCCLILVEFSALVYLLMALICNRGNTGTAMETVIFVESVILGLSKSIFPNLHRLKMAENLNHAIDDWTDAPENEDSHRIMKKYAQAGRLMSLIQLNSGYLCLWCYLLCIIFIPPAQVETGTNTTIVPRNFLLSSSWLGPVTDTQYIFIMICQIVQSANVCTRQGSMDSFFFNVTMHLSGQFKTLARKFSEFYNTKYTEADYKERLGALVRRHCALLQQAQNIEDTFNIVVLLQLLLSAIIIGMLGFQLISAIRAGDSADFLKSSVIMNFMFLQSLIYTYAADFLQSHSSGIFHALYDSAWYKLSPKVTKDLNFIMMRTSVPLRLTGGKFFYVSRKILMKIMKTAASCVSVLQVTLQPE